MNIDRADVVKLLRAFDESDWDTIHISTDDFELYLSNGAVDSQPSAGRARPASNAPFPAPVVAEAEPEPTPPPAPAERNPELDGLRVTAPCVGRFYRAPSPGAPPFVDIGDEVVPDTTVCIVEVMKLMNPVKAQVTGRISAVLVENAQNVERGQPLFVITPSDASEGVG